MKTPDSIIFDLDGTLWDTCSACAVGWNRVLKRNDIMFREITPGDVRSVTGLPHEECIKRVFASLTTKEIALLIEQTQIEDNIAVAEFGGDLYPGVSDGVRQLSNQYPLFIVSNCQSGYIEQFLSTHNMHDYFRDFECWGNTRLSKGENLKSIILRNDLKASVMVGDMESDQNAARENNIAFWHVTYGFGKCTNACRQFDQFENVVLACL